MRNGTGILFVSPLHRNVRPNANLIFHSHAQAAVRRVFEHRWRHSGSPVFVRPQDVDPRHQWNSKLGPFFAHTFPIGKKLEKPNPLMKELKEHSHSWLCGFVERTGQTT
jgi:hypothetical protein